MKNKKAVFLDIDGTLINGNGGPFDDDIAALEEASNAGHFLFINTGRSYANIPERIMTVPFWDGICAGGGAHILRKENKKSGGAYKTIYHKWIDWESLTEICSWYFDSKKQLVLEGEINCYMINPADRNFSVRPAVIIQHRNDAPKIFGDDFVTKLTMNEQMDKTEIRFLEKNLKVNVFPDYAEAILKNENKGNAIRITLESIRLKREDSIAIGDSVNDLDMIRYAGLGAAMGNSCRELMDEADVVTGNCGEGGVSQILRKYVM